MTEFLLTSEYEVKSLECLRIQWSNISNESVRNTIAIEHQYLDFHVNLLLRRLGYKSHSELDNQLNYPLRAGFVRTATHLYLSIAERALSNYIQKFDFDSSPGEHHKTLNYLMSICQSYSPLKVDPILDDLRFLQEMRNTGNGYKLVQEEQRVIVTGNIILNHLQRLSFSGDDRIVAA